MGRKRKGKKKLLCSFQSLRFALCGQSQLNKDHGQKNRIKESKESPFSHVGITPLGHFRGHGPGALGIVGEEGSDLVPPAFPYLTCLFTNPIDPTMFPSNKLFTKNRVMSSTVRGGKKMEVGWNEKGKWSGKDGGKFTYLDGLGDSSDLVDLEQQGIAGVLLNGGGDTDGVGDGQVIADDLDVGGAGQVGPGRPVILIKGILDRDNGIVGSEVLVELSELLTGQVLGGIRVSRLEVEIVLAILVELGGSDIHADLDLVGVTGVGDSGLQELKTLSVVLNVGSESTLISDVGGILTVLLLDDGLEGVVDLGTDLHGLGKGGSAGGQDHELLHGELVSGVGTSVDDVESGDGHDNLLATVSGQVSNVTVERDTLAGSTGPEDGHGDTEDGVGTILGLVDSSIQLDEELVNGDLVLDIDVGGDQSGSEVLVDVLDSLEDTCEGAEREQHVREGQRSSVSVVAGIVIFDSGVFRCTPEGCFCDSFCVSLWEILLW